MSERRKSRQVHLGTLPLGGGAPVVIQSMTNTDTGDVPGTLAQIRRLAEMGCQAVRLAVPDVSVVPGLKKIRAGSPVPLIADIHFDHRLALHALEAGFDKLRINPGTMGSQKAVAEVVAAAKSRGVPIRVGVNSGSIHTKYQGLPRLEGLVASALYYCQLLEDMDFHDIVVSIKSSSVGETYQATLDFARRADYPLHLGVTEAGTLHSSTVKSAMGIGSLLLLGIGDTFRVSVTGPPEEEIPVAHQIMRAAGLSQGIEIISCPTCGRTSFPLAEVAQEVERRLGSSSIPLKVAVMGCAVNGPGEAKHADLGIAFGPERGVLFYQGKILGQWPNRQLVEQLYRLLDQISRSRGE